MDEYTQAELQMARRPIASLIRKSEKAQQKLVQGTWQYRMLADNLEALSVATALMDREGNTTGCFSQQALEKSLHTIASMIACTQNTKTKFLQGTSQHSLQKNRLQALQIAQSLMQQEVDR